eukprot:3531623-Pyramimonas_sp.AAC.1
MWMARAIVWMLRATVWMLKGQLCGCSPLRWVDPRTMDLSCLRNALNGAESVHAATMEAFRAAFTPCGLRRDALNPG